MSRLAADLRIRLAKDASVPYSGDGALDPPNTSAIHAAVLIAITDRPSPGIILTQRTATMRRHAGQVAFPGGRADPDDADDIATALREAREEIDLAPISVEIVGQLPLYTTITGYSVRPVIGVVPPDMILTPHDAEVAAVFEVPLDYIANPANGTTHTVMHEGIRRHYREIIWDDRRIWGATAAMLANLVHRLK